MRRGVIMDDMEHHLEFLAPVPLLRGRNRVSRRGCRWNLKGIIALGRVGKSSIFGGLRKGSRDAERGARAGGWGKEAGGWRKKLVEGKCASRGAWIHLKKGETREKSPIEIGA
jgi:hypothetical protein